FLGITAIPQLLVLALNLVQVSSTQLPRVPAHPVAQPEQFQSTLGVASSGVAILAIVVGFVVYIVAYLFAQGGTVLAVSDLYLGRPTSITNSLKAMRGELGSLFGVIALNGLAVLGATLFLIIPGLYLA